MKEVKRQAKVAGEAYTASEIEYALLTDATGFECGY